MYLIEVLDPDGSLSHASFGTGGQALLVRAGSMEEAHAVAMGWAHPSIALDFAPWGEPQNGRPSIRPRPVQIIGEHR